MLMETGHKSLLRLIETPTTYLESGRSKSDRLISRIFCDKYIVSTSCNNIKATCCTVAQLTNASCLPRVTKICFAYFTRFCSTRKVGQESRPALKQTLAARWCNAKSVRFAVGRVGFDSLVEAYRGLLKTVFTLSCIIMNHSRLFRCWLSHHQ